MAAHGKTGTTLAQYRAMKRHHKKSKPCYQKRLAARWDARWRQMANDLAARAAAEVALAEARAAIAKATGGEP
jgi:hypothetical protein